MSPYLLEQLDATAAPPLLLLLRCSVYDQFIGSAALGDENGARYY